MNLDTLKTELGRDEGVRTEPYDCPAGARTTGVGRNLDANPLTAAEVRVIGHVGPGHPATGGYHRLRANFHGHDDGRCVPGCRRQFADQRPAVSQSASGDFSLQSGSPAIAIGAGLVRPSISYTPIPSDVAVAAM